MKSLCITGNTQYGVDQLAQVVAEAGAQPALPAPRTPPVSMAEWHEAVLGQLPDGADVAQGAIGRVWDQLAGDIFLANRTQALWFWAETRSTALLEFWQSFELNTRFLLVYTDPAAALEHALSQRELSESELDAFLEAWQQSTRQMLRFHLRHPQRSILLPESAAEDATACLSLLGERLGLAGLLELPVVEDEAIEAGKEDWLPAFMQGASAASAETPAAAPAVPASLARHLISQYLDGHPQVLALHEEALACLTMVGSDAATLVAPLSPAAAIRRLFDEKSQESTRFGEASQAYEAQIARLELELQLAAEWKTQAEQTSAQLRDAEAEIHSANQQVNDKSAALAKLEAQLKDSNEENELLLEQLHIVQEELEKAFEWKAKAEQHAAQVQKLDAEFKKRDAEFKKLDAEYKKRDAEYKTLDAGFKKRDADFKKADAELKAAREKAATVDTQFKKSLADLKAANEKIAALDAQLKKSQTELNTTRDKLATEGKQKVSALEGQLKDVNEENELLLEQLHLVQEELERYYLNLKQAEADKLAVSSSVADLEKRVARLYARNPDFWDCDQVSVLPLPADGDTQQAQWTLTGLETAGRYIPTLRLKTTLRNGVAGLVILREGDGDAPLERWPSSYAHTDELPCVVTEGGPLNGSNLALSSLSPADWDVLKKVVLYLVARLENSRPGSLPPGIDGMGLMRGLAQFAKTLHSWPTLMRFKQISISPVTSIPNYAGLAINLSGVSLGDRRFDTLNYQLASVDSVAGQFGQDPRLEFPASAREVLSSWFAETRDDRGERLELRFAKPAVFDINVWRRLSHEDQTVVAALLTAMPMQLAALSGSGQGDALFAGHPPAQWQALSAWMTRTLANSLQQSNRRAARVA